MFERVSESLTRGVAIVKRQLEIKPVKLDEQIDPCLVEVLKLDSNRNNSVYPTVKKSRPFIGVDLPKA